MIEKIECFKIRISEGEISEKDVNKSKTIFEIGCDFPSLKQEPVTIVADPFLFLWNDILYLFYEKKTIHNKADIIMQSTKDLLRWSEPVVVLREDYHLSFPFVFEEDGKVYMIPESCAAESIRLYEASDHSLTSFAYKKTLVKDSEPEDKLFSFSDSVVLKENRVFYLFTSFRNKAGNDVAELYYSDDLCGPYQKHPASPICTNSKYARAAGKIERAAGGLFRYGQDCLYGYGENINVLEILELNKMNYKETLYKENILERTDRFYQYGGHQFSSLVYRGKRIFATDAKEYHLFLLSRAMGKLRRH